MLVSLIVSTLCVQPSPFFEHSIFFFFSVLKELRSNIRKRRLERNGVSLIILHPK